MYQVQRLAALALLALGSSVLAHDGYTVLDLNADQSALLAPARASFIALFGGSTGTNTPGFGLGLESQSPPIGTRLGLETVGGLLYWDGSEIVTTSATFTINAPDTDHFGVPNSTAVSEYAVDADSGWMIGMTWSAYGGGNSWHANGFFTLDNSLGELAAGVYGVPVRIVTMPGGPQLDPTAPFLLPLLYDPAGVWTGAAAIEGSDALESLLATPGDFNADGLVDDSDHALWSANYAAIDAPIGDANGDGLVNAADYTVWRDALTGATAQAVPEPPTRAVSAAGLLLLAAERRRR